MFSMPKHTVVLKFRNTLLNSEKQRTVESSRDLYWSRGPSLRGTAATLPSYLPGHNYLGRVLFTVRAEILEDEKLKLLNPDSPPKQDQPSPSENNSQHLPNVVYCLH